MPKILYQAHSFGPEKLATIAKINEIIAEYTAQGFTLTLRQAYYQMVARDLIANNDREYKKLGEVVSEARLAGLVDWDAIVDRTRNVRDLAHWSSPRDIIDATARSFHVDWWANQKNRVEVWIEKDALVGVIEGVCSELDVPFFSCRGYTSQSEMWVAAQRLLRYRRRGQTPHILHLGDHDPSGKDMSRDIVDRLNLFRCNLGFERLALNFDQVEQYQPPPNPAKITDSRADGYITEFGSESWELDALEPAVLAGLIRAAVSELRDDDLWKERLAVEKRGRALLTTAYTHWDDLVDHLDEIAPDGGDDAE